MIIHDNCHKMNKCLIFQYFIILLISISNNYKLKRNRNIHLVINKTLLDNNDTECYIIF